ncbi:siroheme synthase [mine drainage metagenome]|uniref:Siroheme synthase n=1 Tax=mine drainage metagenome TaxID=410659 RepID=A0A1J5RGN3_9ZZZZ
MIEGEIMGQWQHPLLPLFVDFSGQPCLVVGAGKIAARKTTALIRAGAKVTVVAPESGPEMKELCLSHIVVWHARRYLEEDLSGQRLVVAATSDQTLNAVIAAAAKQQGLLVNVVDPGHQGNAIIPTVIDRSPIQIALFSGGASPALVRQLNRQLEAFIPQAYGRLATFAGTLRERVRQALSEAAQRHRFWREFMESPAAVQVLAGNEVAARNLTELHFSGGNIVVGNVYLIGAGPGDPEQLTLRALRLLQQADIVVHDRLVGSGVMALIPEDVERIDVGKVPGHHRYNQQEINQILIDQARLGKRVVRLKGGDPFIFGRGGEEVEALTAAAIPYQVVSGITAAVACAAIASIPLTHREWSHGCIFLPGQFCDHASEMDWSVFASAKQTLVFYMSVNNIEKICQCLLESGMAANMPAALVQQATLPQQRVSVATVGEWSKPPTFKIEPGILIIGDTVRLSPYFTTKTENIR